MSRHTPAETARLCGLNRSTVTRQARAWGLVGADGLVDLAAYRAARGANIDPALQSRPAPPARVDAVDHGLRDLLHAAASQVPIAVVLAAAEVGLRRDDAARVADLSLLFWAAMYRGFGDLERQVGPMLPAPETWQARINWPALFTPDGRSRVTGELPAASPDDEGDHGSAAAL